MKKAEKSRILNEQADKDKEDGAEDIKQTATDKTVVENEAGDRAPSSEVAFCKHFRFHR